MIHMWLKLRKAFTKLSEAEVTPPVSEHQSPKTNLPIQISEEFIKSKRNLLWFTSANILLFVAAISGSGDSFNAPLLNLVINRKIFSVLILGYCIYIYWIFKYYAKRVKMINSKGAAGLSQDGRSPFDAVTTRLENIQRSLATETGKLVSLDDEIYTNLEGLLGSVYNSVEKNLNDANKSAEKIFKLCEETREVQFERLKSGGYEQLAKDVDSLRSVAENSTSALTDTKRYVESHLRQARDLRASRLDNEAIIGATSAIKKLEDSFDALSLEINGEDSRRFRYYDVLAGRVMLIIACICTFIGLKDSWVATLHGYVTHII